MKNFKELRKQTTGYTTTHPDHEDNDANNEIVTYASIHPHDEIDELIHKINKENDN